ncbi:MAG TPA: hypothetical protein VHY76_03220 [Acetobacteraceae bacterium]|nr:hypothetical protein [Acetobacteraceae bacterium]
MGIEFAAERRLLNDNEYEPIVRSHYPAIGALTQAELVDLAGWLRGQHNRARDIVRHRHRVQRGKAEPQGVAADQASTRGLAAKKQVFARALKRVNARLHHLAAADRRAKARAGAAASLRDALARRQAAPQHHPPGGWTEGSGMRSKQSARRRTNVPPSRIGSISQAGKASQSARDNPGG